MHQVFPGTCTTPPRIDLALQISGDSRLEEENIGVTTVSLSVTQQFNSVILNEFYGKKDLPLTLKLGVAAAGCGGTVPNNYNIIVGYQTGIKIIRY